MLCFHYACFLFYFIIIKITSIIKRRVSTPIPFYALTNMYTTVPSLYVVRVPEFRDSGIPIGRYTCYYLIKIKIKTTRVKY